MAELRRKLTPRSELTARYSLGMNSVEIEVLGYLYPSGTVRDEFGRVQRDFLTRNWLNVRVSMADSLGSSEVSVDCFLTTEIELLARWFDGVAAGDYNLAPLHSIERYPRFDIERLPSRHPMMSVTFQWWPVCEDLKTVKFDADPVLLRAFAADLRRDLQAFPIRGGELSADFPMRLRANRKSRRYGR